MLQSTPEWEAFERDQIRREPKGWHASLRLFEDMIAFAEEMGQLPPENRLQGIQEDISLAKALNVRLKT